MQADLFIANFAPLTPENPARASVAVLPWDTNIFHFPVGEFKIDRLPESRTEQDEIRSDLMRWAENSAVELVACRLDANDTASAAVLQRFGFQYIETSLQATRRRVAATPLVEGPVATRLAEPADATGLGQIAASSVKFGRYHADVQFPKELANERYCCWIGRALETPQEGTRVFVAEVASGLVGFLHVELNGIEADLRLGAIHPSKDFEMHLFYLYAAVLNELADLGIKNITARVAATDMVGLNLYSALGFRFSRPEVVMHWHRARSQFLVPWRQVSRDSSTELSQP